MSSTVTKLEKQEANRPQDRKPRLGRLLIFAIIGLLFIGGFVIYVLNQASYIPKPLSTFLSVFFPALGGIGIVIGGFFAIYFKSREDIDLFFYRITDFLFDASSTNSTAVTTLERGPIDKDPVSFQEQASSKAESLTPSKEGVQQVKEEQDMPQTEPDP